MSIEIGIPTKRPFPIEILETLNWQTDKDFTLKILLRGSQPWTVEELKNALDFPVEVYPQTLYYSNGTRYCSSLALNELLTHVESDYIYLTEDYCVINPRTIEIFRRHAQKDLVLQGFRHKTHQPWTPDADYPDFKNEFEGKPREYSMRITPPKNPWISLNNSFLPTNILKRVNGFDCAYDGQWGVMEFDLTERILRAGYKIGYIPAIAQYTSNHTSHHDESDDPAISDELFAYNKETSSKNHTIKHCWPSWGGSTQYRMWSSERNTIEAPFGFREVEALMNGG